MKNAMTRVMAFYVIFRFLQHVYATFAEAEIGGVSHLIDLAAHRAVIRQLYQSVAYHDVVILVSAHEAAQHYLARQSALVCQDARLGAEHHFAGLTHLSVQYFLAKCVMPVSAARQ